MNNYYQNKKCQPRSLVIIGAGGHAVSVANVALSMGYKIECFVDGDKGGLDLLGIRIISDLGKLKNINELSFAIAIGDNSARERVYNEMIAAKPSLHFPALVHASAVISFFSDIECGALIMPLSIIGPNSKIGKFCIINTRASLDHDCLMLDYSSLAPAVVTGGNVTIGKRSAVSIGASIKHGLQVGDDTIVGAHSYLNRDLPNKCVAYGVPAKLVRMRSISDKYLE